jgi:hypothetical protein
MLSSVVLSGKSKRTREEKGKQRLLEQEANELFLFTFRLFQEVIEYMQAKVKKSDKDADTCLKIYLSTGSGKSGRGIKAFQESGNPAVLFSERGFPENRS